MKVAVYTAAVFNTKMAINTAAGPSYKTGYIHIHGSRLQCKDPYIHEHSCRAHI